uniref:Transmembrane protein n=1 Tax=Panagrellus redivivus TaxID=6233 RepID=A0A7E5A045_PANRE
MDSVTVVNDGLQEAQKETKQKNAEPEGRNHYCTLQARDALKATPASLPGWLVLVRFVVGAAFFGPQEECRVDTMVARTRRKQACRLMRWHEHWHLDSVRQTVSALPSEIPKDIHDATIGGASDSPCDEHENSQFELKPDGSRQARRWGWTILFSLLLMVPPTLYGMNQSAGLSDQAGGRPEAGNRFCIIHVDVARLAGPIEAALLYPPQSDG